MDDLSNSGSSAVYVGWSTFKNHVLEGLTHGGLPTMINRSVFSGQSGGVQSQLLTGMKFLGLTDERGKPTKALHDLTVPDESSRKQALAEVLRASYPDVFKLDIGRTTPQELADTMASSYNVNRDTKERAVRFFLAAAQYAGIQLSPYLLKTNGAANGRRAKRRARTVEPAPTPTPTASPPAPAAPTTPATPTSGQQRMVSLVSGAGSITLSVSVDPFRLTSDDRAFIFKMIDLLTEYEKTNKSNMNERQIDEEDTDEDKDDEDDNEFGGPAQ
jgi:hypothetical protein